MTPVLMFGMHLGYDLMTASLLKLQLIMSYVVCTCVTFSFQVFEKGMRSWCKRCSLRETPRGSLVSLFT
ncbi:hypothetical protein LINPERHAP2_LOCUS20548 [Linum perenne]